MGRERLTDAKIRALKPMERAYNIPDPECPGLYVRVRPSGAKAFTIVARDPTLPAGRNQVWRAVAGTTVGIDRLEDVREKAREGIRRIKSGLEAFPPPAPRADTFQAVADDFLKRHVHARKLLSAPEIKRRLKRYVLPAWADRPFIEIKRGDINRLLNRLVDENGARQADLVLSDIRKIMNWYASQGADDDYVSPVVRGMRRASPNDRERILSDDELRLFWPLLEAGGVYEAILQVSLLTAQRITKVRTMGWAHVSADGTWTIPGQRGEKGNGGTLRLPALALAVIRRQHRIARNPFVFAGQGRGAYNGISRAKEALDARLLARLQDEARERGEDPRKVKPVPHWTNHDLRRTARSLMSRAGVDSDTAEMVLGHKLKGVRGIYDRHQYVEEKAAALGKLAGLVGEILEG